MELNGKVAIVTGGASGLGSATVDRLVAGGARVAILDVNDARGGDAARVHGSKVAYFKTDVADDASVAQAIAGTSERFGALHVCVNCAGIGIGMKTVSKDGPHPLAPFRRVVEVNLIGTFNVIRLAAAEMAKNEPIGEAGERGAIVSTASVAAEDGQMGQAAYSASKGGVVGMTLPIARDLASLGIRNNTILPGLFQTPMFDGLPENVIEGLVGMIQFPKRLGHPDEYAALVAHIVENPYLNGATIRLDAGVRMQAR